MINKDNYYSLSLISIKIGDILFRIPREDLENESIVIQSLFNEDGKPKGLSDEEPLLLEDINASAFRALLNARIPEYLLPNQAILGEEELVSALILADKWQLSTTRQVLIRKLEQLSLSLARKLELARNHKIKQWYHDELRKLAMRECWLNMEEAQQLGLELTVILGWFRETRKRKFSQAFDASYIDPSMEKELDRKLDEYINPSQISLTLPMSEPTCDHLRTPSPPMPVPYPVQSRPSSPDIVHSLPFI